MFKRVSGRVVTLLPVIIVQIALIYLLFSFLAPFTNYIVGALSLVAVVLSIIIISKQDVVTYKMAWLFFILIFPIIGSVAYIVVGNKKTGKKLKNSIDKAKADMNYYFPESPYVWNAVPKNRELRAYETLAFAWRMTGMQTYKCGDAKYYPVGDEMLPDLLADLENAKEFLFIEYFIIEEGKFLNSMVDILERKVKEGVDVRVMYDDFGSLPTYSRKSAKMLAKKGIKVVQFNPIKYLTLKINNRDHRKMTIIDGKIAYSGGVNIADEYINEKVVHGHWKDIAFRVDGDSVINYTYMFAEFWNAFSDEKIPEKFLPSKCDDKGENGYIYTYYDSPVHENNVCNTLHIEFLSQATKYIWFYTPYLMLDASLNDALIRAARRGVDVRIIVPGIPDKKLVYRVSRSYYGPLLENGVRIFEYTPGFVHAKAMVCDDGIASIGTSNLDFRSLFLHFECNSIFANCSIVDDLKKDFEETLQKCRERKLDDGLPGTKYGVAEALLRLISPLM